MAAPLSPKRRSELRAEAHKLSPTVIIGDKGLTDQVLAEIDRSLKAHELIKVRAATDERDARNVWMESICEKLDAHPVQQIGKVLVVYRENPDAAPAPKPASAPKRRVRPAPAAPARLAHTPRPAHPRSKTPAIARPKTPARPRSKPPAAPRSKTAAGPRPKPAPQPRSQAPADDARRTSRRRSRTP